MSDRATDGETDPLVLEFDLDAAPDKVWQAVRLDAFRKEWLPEADLADSEPLAETPGREVSYKMREDAPPHLESVVTFRIRPGRAGGTILRIVHEVADRRTGRPLSAANGNTPPLMLAA